jgi:hypothetical protein
LVKLAGVFLTRSLTIVSMGLVRARTKQVVAALCVVSGFGLAACGGSARRTSTVAQASPPAATTNVAETLSTSSTKTTSGRPAGHAPRAKKVTERNAAKPSAAAPATSPDPVSASTTTSVSTSSTTTSAKKHRPHPYVPAKAPPIVPSSQSRSVLACLARSGVTHASQGSNTVWSGYDLKTGTFVFVYLYPTAQKAIARARFLSREEVAHAGRYLIQQPIDRYAGSPVAAVTVCLGGKPPKAPAPKPGSFTF